MKRSKTICCLLLPVLFGSGLFISLFMNRTSAQEKKQEEFGSSLKRLKWDKEKSAAVDKKSGKEAAKQTPSSTEEQGVIKIETSLVTFDLLVTDRQGYVINGLAKEDFIVTENGTLQSVNTVSRGDDANLARSIILIFDYSGSQYPYLQLSIAAAKTLIAKLKPKDKMAVVTDDVALLQDFTNDKNQLYAALDKIQKRVFTDRKVGKSMQYSALFAVMQELLEEAERPIIILQTDGDQWIFLRPVTEVLPRGPGRVSFGLADVITAAQRERVTIYAVIPGLQLIGFSPDEQLARAKQILRACLEIQAADV